MRAVPNAWPAFLALAREQGRCRFVHARNQKQRWSHEAAEMFLTGNPLRSAYRVIARDGRIIWFHCEAKMIRQENGEPWFTHGVGFDPGGVFARCER